MVVPGLAFVLFMLAGAVAIVTAVVWQMRLMRAGGLSGRDALPAAPFSVKSFNEMQARMATLRAQVEWKRMRLLLWAGAFLTMLGALMLLPDVLR
ncbi:MAG: hypothetical protein QM759_02895 [Terricaulis sp.]